MARFSLGRSRWSSSVGRSVAQVASEREVAGLIGAEAAPGEDDPAVRLERHAVRPVVASESVLRLPSPEKLESSVPFGL
jgi:hypothetical protein